MIYRDHWNKVPLELHLRKLENGYLLGDTYVKDEEDLADYLVILLKNPEADFPTPVYQKTN